MLTFRNLLPLYAVIALGFFGYALTITLFIPMLLDPNVALLPSTTSTAVRASLTGFLLAMYPLGQFFGSPIIGSLSDHFGRKKVLLTSLAACVIGFLGMSLSITTHHITLLFLFSFFTGLCESNMAISQSIIADRVSDEAQKAKLIGYAFSACSVGYILGPLLGGSAGSLLSYSAPFWITALGVFALIVWLVFYFEDQSLPQSDCSINIIKSITAISSIFHDKKLINIYFINFLIFFSVQGLYRVVPLYVVDTWQPSLHIYSLLISAMSFVCFLSTLLLIAPFAKRFATKTLLSGALLIGCLCVIIIVIPTEFHWIWLTYGLAAIPTVIALPTCTSWLSNQVAPSKQGQVLGNNQALLVLGEATSAAIGGLIAAIWIPLPVITMAIILFITGLMVYHTQR